MMYSNNLAAAIIVGGKVLREFGDTVYLPFGSEYKIRIKNLNSVRAKVSIEIDGDSATDGSVVVDAFGTTDLERFICNGNLNRGHRFKFIERSEKIEQYRGIGAEDGIVSIRYEFEVAPKPSYRGLASQYDLGPYYGGLTKGIATNSVPTASLNSVPVTASTGITTQGSLSNQQFTTTRWAGSQPGTHVLNIRLLGDTGEGAPVMEAVTVKTKARCKTCGTLNKATAKFCVECGTSLIVL